MCSLLSLGLQAQEFQEENPSDSAPRQDEAPVPPLEETMPEMPAMNSESNPSGDENVDCGPGRYVDPETGSCVNPSDSHQE